MYNLQALLDKRLATLNKNKATADKSINLNNTSKAYIEDSLKQAGILNKQGKIIHKVVIS